MIILAVLGHDKLFVLTITGIHSSKFKLRSSWLVFMTDIAPSCIVLVRFWSKYYNSLIWDWRNGLEINNIYLSSRGPKFFSQHPQCGSQPPISLAPED